MMTMGSSTETARLMASLLSATPGPEVEVTASWPVKAAPMVAQMAAISSSAWKVVTSKFLYLDSSCSTSEAGVMG
jgi:hypothetical protein